MFQTRVEIEKLYTDAVCVSYILVCMLLLFAVCVPGMLHGMLFYGDKKYWIFLVTQKIFI